MWVYLDQMTYSCSVRFSDGGAAIAQSRRQCVEEFRCRLTKKKKDTNQIGFSIYAKFLSRKLFWALYLIPPPSPLFSLISVCWLISDVSCTSKRFITTMKVEGLVLFEKGYVRDYESNEQNTTVTSSVKSNER